MILQVNETLPHQNRASVPSQMMSLLKSALTAEVVPGEQASSCSIDLYHVFGLVEITMFSALPGHT